jgi:hypothetical protein
MVNFLSKFSFFCFCYHTIYMRRLRAPSETFYRYHFLTKPFNPLWNLGKRKVCSKILSCHYLSRPKKGCPCTWKDWRTRNENIVQGSSTFIPSVSRIWQINGTSVLWRSLGKCFDIMAVLYIVLLQTTNKSNLTLPNLTCLVYTTLTLLGATFPSP